MSGKQRTQGRRGALVEAARRVLSPEARLRLRRALTVWPPVRMIRFGSLRRLTPFSRSYGFERGTPIDRYYISAFLSRYAGAEGYTEGDIRGRVLEVGDDMYTRTFGSGVEQVEILHAGEARAEATIVGDLTSADDVPSNAFDCVICTQTLNLIYETPAAIRTLHSALKPGGVVLATVPGISQTIRPERDFWGDYWRFTTLSARRMFEEFFPPENVTVESYGNVLSAAAFLYGVAAEELKQEELDPRDPDYEFLIAIRAIK